MKKRLKEEIRKLIGPTVVEFDLHDLMQVIIGASIIAVPVIFSQQSWGFIDILPWANILSILGLTVIFIACFTYFHYHKDSIGQNPRYHFDKLIKRVFGTYVLSFIVVGVILSVIQVIDLNLDLMNSLKRIIVINFPSAMGAAISDKIK